MIVTCPNCETRFLVDDAALSGGRGRRIRCASCGNLWFYSAEAATIHAAVEELVAEAEAHAAARTAAAPTTAAPTPGLRAEPGAGTAHPPMSQPAAAPDEAAPPQPPMPIVELRAASRRRGARVGGLTLLVFAFALLVAAILARDTILTLYPSTAPVYETLHLIEPSGAGLTIKLAPATRTPDSLVARGSITNSTTLQQRVPRLRVTLQDGTKNDLESIVVDPPVAQLAPGATEPFTAVFPHPSITGSGVEVGFAAD